MATTVENLLDAVKKLSPDELSEFSLRLAEWQESDSLAGQPESLLIEQTKRRLPSAEAKRLHELAANSEGRTLTPAELKEYRQLAQRAESVNAARVLALAELARRRGRPVSEVMKLVGWQEEPHGA